MAIILLRNKEDQYWDGYVERISGMGRMIKIIGLEAIPPSNGGELAGLIAQAVNEAAEEGDEVCLFDNLYIPRQPVRFGMGIEVLKYLRFHEFFMGRKNIMQGSKVTICSLLPLEWSLRLNPDYLLALSPNVEFIDLLGCFPRQLEECLRLPCYSLDKKAFKQIIPYMPHVPRFPKGKTRHSAASLFGVHIMINFAKAVYRESQAVKSNGLWIASDVEKYIDGFEIKELEEVVLNDSWLRQCLFSFGRRLEGLSKIRLEATYIIGLIKEIKDNLYSSSNEYGKIGLIDDEALQMKAASISGPGWLMAFKAVLFDHENLVEEIIGQCETVQIDKVEEDSLDLITKQVGKADYRCILLDIHLNREKEKEGVRNKLGARLLKKLRVKYPAIPIIVATATNKPWKHRILIDYGADAVWVKEGIDENRSPNLSYYNIIRLLELLRRVTGSRYQFLNRFGGMVEQIRSGEKNYWWARGEISWKHAGLPAHGYSRSSKKFMYSRVDHGKLKERIVAILQDGLRLLRSYLHETVVNFDEATGYFAGEKPPPISSLPDPEENDTLHSRVNFLAMTIVIHLVKIIELIHGQRAIHNAFDGRINASVIGGHLCKREKRYRIIRGDWIGYYLYQYRNECAHYFEEVKYCFGDNALEGRYLTHIISHLMAYLSMERQPYFSKDEEEMKVLKGRKGHKVNPNYLAGLIERKASDHRIKEHHDIYKKLRYGE